MLEENNQIETILNDFQDYYIKNHKDLHYRGGSIKIIIKRIQEFSKLFDKDTLNVKEFFTNVFSDKKLLKYIFLNAKNPYYNNKMTFFQFCNIKNMCFVCLDWLTQKGFIKLSNNAISALKGLSYNDLFEITPEKDYFFKDFIQIINHIDDIGFKSLEYYPNSDYDEENSLLSIKIICMLMFHGLSYEEIACLKNEYKCDKKNLTQLTRVMLSNHKIIQVTKRELELLDKYVNATFEKNYAQDIIHLTTSNDNLIRHPFLYKDRKFEPNKLRLFLTNFNKQALRIGSTRCIYSHTLKLSGMFARIYRIMSYTDDFSFAALTSELGYNYGSDKINEYKEKYFNWRKYYYDK